MICRLCKQKGIRVVNPYWLEGNTIECCCNCATKLNLQGINIVINKERIIKWKAHRPAKLENE